MFKRIQNVPIVQQHLKCMARHYDQIKSIIVHKIGRSTLYPLHTVAVRSCARELEHLSGWIDSGYRMSAGAKFTGQSSSAAADVKNPFCFAAGQVEIERLARP